MADLGKILLLPKGNYDGTTTYTFLDIVVYDRSTYVCKVASSVGVLPTNTTNWQIMSEHGADAFGYGYIRYSEYADGTNFVDTPTALTDYIGFYMGNSVTPPVDKTAYTWSKFVGHDGATGVGIASITKTGTIGLIDTYTIAYTDSSTSTFNVTNGTGNAFYWSNVMNNTTSTAQIYPTSGITTAVIGDMNINPDSWDVYKCTVGGAPAVAEWLYTGNIKGASGTGAGDMLSTDYVGAGATRSVHAADTLNSTLGNIDELSSSDFQVVSSELQIKDAIKDINSYGTTTTLADPDNVAVSTGSASNKKITWSNFKLVLKTYFDSLYALASHTHTKSQITDFPTIPTITDTYSGTSSDGMSGKAVKSAIDALDVTTSGASASKTITALSQTDGKISATFSNISITKSQISDFPTIPTVNNATLTIQKNGSNVQTFTANQSTNATANIITDDWVKTASVSSGSVTFSGIDDSGNYGYEVFFNITSSSTNKNPSAQLSAISGEGTANMSLTYTTDADNGTNNAKLRRIK